MKKILALDLATHLGWAHNYDGKIKYGTEDFTNKPWDGCGMRFLKFRVFLEKQAPDIVVYENVMSHGAGGIHAQHLYGSWMGILQEHCELYDIPYDGYPVGTIKEFWTGKGNASKTQMIHEARKRGFNPKTDDEADALAVLHLCIDTLQVWD